MTDHDEESLAEWLFYARKQHRRRTTHRTLSSAKIKQENNE